MIQKFLVKYYVELCLKNVISTFLFPYGAHYSMRSSSINLTISHNRQHFWRVRASAHVSLDL